MIEGQAASTSQQREPNGLRFVACHWGVGSDDSQANFVEPVCRDVMAYSDVCMDKICDNRLCEASPQQSCAQSAAVKLVAVLEHKASMNCGFGSNLNSDGEVECDASLMCGNTGSFAGVGAIRGCKNPIRLAESLLHHGNSSKPLGLVQPNMLAGATGGKQWMREHCPHLLVADSKLIAPRALSRYTRHKSRLDEANAQKLDTVGAITVSCQNNIACATSSGGISLKHRGRLGQAALPGAGCWASQSVGAVTSGVGEVLTANLFARTVHDKLDNILEQSQSWSADLTETIENVICECFATVSKSQAIGHLSEKEKIVGILATMLCPNGCMYIILAHNTTSMPAAYCFRGQDGDQFKCLEKSTQKSRDGVSYHITRLDYGMPQK